VAGGAGPRPHIDCTGKVRTGRGPGGAGPEQAAARPARRQAATALEIDPVCSLRTGR
jgi:hypothetical protein